MCVAWVEWWLLLCLSWVVGLVVCLLLFNCIWLVYDGVVLALYGLLLMLVIVV